MASSFPLGDILQARSAPSTTTPLAIPLVIAISSAAGISSLIIISALAIALYRRNHGPTSRKSIATLVVPRLTITDTSRFPASTLIVASETTLDGVIASFRPLGTEPDVTDETLASNIYDDECDLFPLPKIPKNKNKLAHNGLAQPTYGLETFDEQFEYSSRAGDTLTLSHATDSAYALTAEGVWWHDFNVETRSFSDTQSSIYSMASESDMPATPDYPRISYGTSKITQDSDIRNLTVKQEGLDASNSSGTRTEDSMQNELYDEDVLAYCWRLSEGDYGMKSGQSSFLDTEADVQDVDAMLDGTSSEVDIADSYIIGGTFDSQILEYCWRISDVTPSKSADRMKGSESATIRYTKAARLVSNASVAVLSRRRHDSGNLVFPWDSCPSDDDDNGLNEPTGHIDQSS